MCYGQAPACCSNTHALHSPSESAPAKVACTYKIGSKNHFNAFKLLQRCYGATVSAWASDKGGRSAPL